MRRVFIGTAVLFFSVFFFSTSCPALAHFFETDKTITGELHVEPNDNPIPKENAVLNFRFVDSTKRFTIAGCTCTLVITENGKEIFRTQLSPRSSKTPSIYDAELTYPFPQKALYNIVLTGTPKIVGTFDQFNLGWDFRVTQNPKSKPIDFTKTLLTYFTFILGGFILIALLLAGFFVLRKLFSKNNL